MWMTFSPWEKKKMVPKIINVNMTDTIQYNYQNLSLRMVSIDEKIKTTNKKLP